MLDKPIFSVFFLPDGLCDEGLCFNSSNDKYVSSRLYARSPGRLFLERQLRIFPSHSSFCRASKIVSNGDGFCPQVAGTGRDTPEIKESLQNTLNPLVVAVVIEAQHMCMSMRGIQKQNSVSTTSDFTGAFLSEKTRAEFIHLIGSNLH